MQTKLTYQCGNPDYSLYYVIFKKEEDLLYLLAYSVFYLLFHQCLYSYFCFIQTNNNEGTMLATCYIPYTKNARYENSNNTIETANLMICYMIVIHQLLSLSI